MDEARDVLVGRNVTLARASRHLGQVLGSEQHSVHSSVLWPQCYLESLNAVVTLQNTYLEAKAEKNIFQRYTQLRNMIKAVSGLRRTHQQLITSYTGTAGQPGGAAVAAGVRAPRPVQDRLDPRLRPQVRPGHPCHRHLGGRQVSS